MRHIYMAYPMTVPNGTVSPMKALACWLRTAKKYRVFEPKYELFPQKLVRQALERLESSFLLIADVTQPSHGVGFEIGYAHCSGKKVILVAEGNPKGRVSKFLSTVFPDVIYFTGSGDLIEKVSERLAATSRRPAARETDSTDKELTNGCT